MKTYRHSFTVNAPLSAVAEFHKDTRALHQLSPPLLIVQFNNVQPLGEGSVADFTMWAGPVPVRWVAVHSQVTEQNGFVDTQKRGPFRSWQHHHFFRALDEQTTEVIDKIEAEYGNVISRFMWLNLPLLFAYRAWRTKAALDIEKQTKKQKRLGRNTIMDSNIITSPDLARFENQQFMNLETFRKNEEGVKTPVWFVLDKNIIYVRTGKDSWKVKRLRYNPQVRIVPSDRVGQPLDNWVMAKGEVVEAEAEAQTAKDLFKRKYGMQMRFFELMGRVRGYQLLTLAFTANGSTRLRTGESETESGNNE